MTAVSLFDLLARQGTGKADQSAPADLESLVEKLASASLADLDRVREYERDFGPARYDDQGVEVARSILELYREWLTEAEEVLKRAGTLGSRGQGVKSLKPLEDATGRIQARLALSIEQIAHAANQISNGESVPIQELRDELRTRIRA